MKDHRYRLGSFCCKLNIRAFNVRAPLLRAERKLTADELAKAYARPTTAAQKSMRIRQRNEAAVEHIDEFVSRLATFPRPLGYGGNAGEHVLHAMVEFGDQKTLLVLVLSPLGHIDIDTRHALGAASLAIGDEASRFNPSHFSARPDIAKFIDELPSSFLERADVCSADALYIVPMHARPPLFRSDIHGALRQALGGNAGA